MLIAVPAGRALLQTPACAKAHVPRQDSVGWEPLCFLSFKLQYSLKGQGVSVLCCRCLCISWRGLLERGEQGWGSQRSGGSAPGNTAGTGSGWRAECGQGVPSTMKVLDLEELNGSPGDKREI